MPVRNCGRALAVDVAGLPVHFVARHRVARVSDDAGDPACWAHLLTPEDGPDDAMLARLVRRLADAVIVCEPSGRIVLWNDAATALFGFTVEDAIGASLDLIIPEKQRPRHWEGWRRVMQTGETQYGDRLLEVPAMHKDGHRFSIAFTVTLLTLPGESHPVGIAAVVRDDTARRDERRRLQEELAGLRTASPSD
jgi:PAS domain S-box-containing protein